MNKKYDRSISSLVRRVIFKWLRGLDCRGHYYAIITSSRRRALYKDKGKCKKKTKKTTTTKKPKAKIFIFFTKYNSLRPKISYLKF